MLTGAAAEFSDGGEHSGFKVSSHCSETERLLSAQRVTAFMQGMMKTEAGKRMAQQRHQVMEQFLQDFHREWDANA